MTPPPAPLSDKRALRARLRATCDAFVIERRPAPVPPPPGWAGMLRPGRVVAAYLPLGSEADPAELVAAARAAGCTLALPRTIDRETPIAFHRWDAGDEVETGPFGLRQPAAGAPVVRPDLILVPMVGFDRACNRIGQGAGHYDRALALLPDAATIGIAWSVQQVARVPVDPWDRPLDRIATEAGCFERRAS